MTEPRPDLSSGFKLATVWLLIGTAVFLFFLWREREAKKTLFVARGETIELRRGDDGHYHWPGRIEGRAVDFLVDTGATGVAIPASLAESLRLPGEGRSRSSTAGGIVVGEVVRGDVELQGGVSIRRLRMVALPALEAPLLGMDVLGRLPWRQQRDVLVVELGGDGDGAPARR